MVARGGAVRLELNVLDGDVGARRERAAVEDDLLRPAAGAGDAGNVMSSKATDVLPSAVLHGKGQ